MEKFNLKEFYTFNEPCLFFGIYNDDDINILKRTKETYIIWGGTDLDISYQERLANYNIIKSLYNIKCNYAISNDIENRMIKLKMKYTRINFSLLNKNNFYPVTLPGDNIFIYNGITPGNENIYNEKLYKKIQQKLPYFNYIYSTSLNLPNDKMADIYKKCFIGLRLTKNDGNANMVQEMDYMHLPIIHNGDIQNSLSWNSEEDIIDHINSAIPNILIIFEKDMNLSDGSAVWLFNFIKLLHLYNPILNVTILCKKLNNKINIKNVNFIINCDDYTTYNHVFYRINNKIINFECYNNVTIIIHNYDYSLLDYYKKFKFTICHSILIKDELIFNNVISNINILPPLIEKIHITNKNNDKIIFCYNGTIKQSYKSLEMLQLFEILSKSYDFTFYLIYGKHKLDNNDYDNKLNILINKLQNNPKFTIYKNLHSSKIHDILNIAHYGLVIHDETVDYMQQSTKLIEYLSFNCIPISYLTYLNCGYIDNDNLYFKSDNELNLIITKILDKEIKFNEINITNKINNHLLINNLNIFDINNNIFITNKEVKNCDKILITNFYNNVYFNKKVIFIQNNLDFDFHSENIKKILCNDIDKNINEDAQIEINFKLSYLGNYKLYYNENLYDFKKNPQELKLYGIENINGEFIFNSCENYFEFNCFLQKDYIYYLNIDAQFLSPGTLFILSITNVNGIFKDINRNLHIINNNNNKITLSICPQTNSDFIIKIKPSSRNFKKIVIKINDLKIKRIHSIDKLCNKIKVINMDKEKNNFAKVNRILEMNGIVCERSIGIDGQKPEIKKIYDEYCKQPFNEIEKKLKRKEIVSSGALGYLLSMLNIFKEAIINNYEYIMIFDDDIKIINNFIYKFNDLYNSIKFQFRILMLGSSQWEWDYIDFKENYYIPDSQSNGSFANIYHRTTFDLILSNILKFNSPFDSNPLKLNFNKNLCYIAYPNLVIAQLEKSNIGILNNSRTYERFRWDNQLYFNYNYDLKNSKIIYKKINNKLNKKLFIIGITTFNRIKYLTECITSLLDTLNKNVDYIIIVADGNSKDNTQEYIKNLVIPDNVSLYLVCNYEHFIYRQSNSILKLSNQFNFDFAFLINDDVIFMNSNWDIYYYNTYIKTNYDHLVFYDINHKNYYHKIKNNNNLLISYTNANNCQGAFFTFTKKIIKNIGYFDESNFKIRGHSHIDYTIRCCRNKFNNEDYLYDAIESSKYIKLNINNYESSFNKLPLYLRELYKVTLYELERRLNILKDKNRNYINVEFSIEDIN